MIISFYHKGLERFYLTGDKSGIQASHAEKIAKILSRLDSSFQIGDMSIPGWNLHQLQGTSKNHWSVKVSASWRITFKLENGKASIVDYQNYH